MSASPSLPEKETVLRVDLWADDWSHPNEEDVPPLALAMVADLLASSVTLSAEPTCASFQGPIQAIAAARHLERLLGGFSRAWPEGPLQAKVTISTAADSVLPTRPARSQPPASPVSAAKVSAGPVQILLVGELCDIAADIPGLRFAPVAQEGASAALTIVQLLPPDHMPGFIEDPVDSRVRLPKPKPRLEIAPTAVMPAFRPDQAGSPSAARPAVTLPVEPVFEAAEAPVVPVKLPARYIILGVAALVLIGIVLAMLPLLRKSSKPSRPAEQTATQPVSRDVPSGTPVAPAAPTLDSAPPAVAKKKVPDPKAAPARVEPPVTPPAEAKNQPPARVSGSHLTFSNAEIDSIVARADKHSGDGDYAKAIQEYLTVLNQDPSNAAAKRGLAKAQYNQNHQ